MRGKFIVLEGGEGGEGSGPEVFDSGKFEAEARRKMAEFEAAEKEKDKKFEQMRQLADDLGCRNISNPATRSIEFKTWQEALDFQDFYKEEMKFVVRIVEPPQKDHSVFGQGFQVYPVWQQNKK